MERISARRVLFLLPDMFSPPTKGYQVRCLGIAKGLSPRYVTRIVAARTSPNCESVGADRRPLDRIRALFDLIRNGGPVQAALFDGSDVIARIQQISDEWQPNAIVIVTERLPLTAASLSREQLIIDACDSLEQSMRARAARFPLMAWLWNRESRAFKRNAQRMRAYASAILVCSPTMLAYHPSAEVVRNAGPDQVGPRPRPSIDVVFTGTLSYWPNARAALEICEVIAPRIHTAIPSAAIVIAGYNPSAKVRRACSRAGVDLRANVADMGEILRSSRLALAPLEWTPGGNLKILEAITAGTPVLAYRGAAEQVPDANGVLICDGPTEMADAAIDFLQGNLLANSENVPSYTWSSSAREVERLLDNVLDDHHDYPCEGSRNPKQYRPSAPG